jgi:hypothetical protein
MAFRDPFAAYNAANNLEAHLVCNLLNEAGVEAVVIEDVSQVGVWIGGVVSEIHKPQVWIERANIGRAKPVLDEYERRMVGQSGESTEGPPVKVTCEECGQISSFPATQKGSVQNCPHCQAYVDVGDEAQIEEWDQVTGEEEETGES